MELYVDEIKHGLRRPGMCARTWPRSAPLTTLPFVFGLQ